LYRPLIVLARALMLLYPSSGGFLDVAVVAEGAHQCPEFAGEESL
jgi:hypothetical protein